MAGSTISSWFDFPFLEKANHALTEAVGLSWLGGKVVHDFHHVWMAAIIFVLLVYFGLSFNKGLARSDREVAVPDPKFNMRSFFEVICDYTFGTMSGIMGDKAARFFLPFIGTFAFFIMFSNLFGLIPGFLPATDSLNTTLACSILVFFATHIYGVKENGLAHFGHMMGPSPWLAPLIFPIELIGHLARPVSLALRLAGNMIGDHKAVSIFIGLTYLVVPVALLGLGVIVCLVQTLVFCLLSTVYIGMAIEHHDHSEAH
jgi:F-type H+-transporting ATPase subunit a